MRAPESRITSGMRKEPPISTCWPRETTTSRRAPSRRWGRPGAPAPAAPGWPARPAPVESAPAGPGSRRRSEATRQRAGVQADVSGALAEYGCGSGLEEDPHHGSQDAEVEQVGP